MEAEVRKPLRATKEMPRPAPVSMPRPGKSSEIDVAQAPQTRPQMARFRLQVDRQTKATFAALDDARRAGQAIKKAFPVVQVSIYDAEQSAQASLD